MNLDDIIPRVDNRSVTPASAIAGIGTLLALIGLLWYFRPWEHPIVYGLVFKYPGVLQWWVVGTLASVGYSHWRSRQGKGRFSLVIPLCIVFIVGLVLGVGVGSVYTDLHKADSVQDRVEPVNTLPQTDAENPRILPYEVAEDYASNSIRYPRHQIGQGDITYINGTQHWAFPLSPNGPFNWLYAGNQAGAVYVDMSTSDSNVHTVETEFSHGTGMFGPRNYEWHLKKSNFWVEYEDPMPVPTAENQYNAVPYQEHSIEFRVAPIPQFYGVPKYGEEKSGLIHDIAVAVGLSEEDEQYGGVAVLAPNGSIDHVEPRDTQTHPVLHNQRVYPYELARYEVESMRYKLGAINKWFFHDEELQLAATPGSGNDQPFTVTTEEGIKYLTAVEPANQGSGVYQVWIHDAQTGEISQYEVPKEQSLIGPTPATEFTMTEIDRQGLEAVEPIPAIVDGQLYWQVKVLPDDGRGIRYTGFVNATSSDVTLLREDADVRAFLAGADVDPTTPGNDTDSGTPSSQSGTLVITIERADGSVEHIEVEEGSTVTIEHETNATSTPTPDE